MYIDNQVSTFCVLSPLNLSIFKFDAVLKILKFWLVPDESVVATEAVGIGTVGAPEVVGIGTVGAPEVVGIGSVAAGKELSSDTNLTIDGLMYDCGVLSGVPGVVEDVGCSVWCRGEDCGRTFLKLVWT